MRYFVKIGARELEVELGSKGIRVDGVDVDADLLEMDGTEVHSLLLGGASHRILATRSGAEEWTLHLGGLQLRAQVVDERTRAIREMTGVKEGGAGPEPSELPCPAS